LIFSEPSEFINFFLLNGFPVCAFHARCAPTARTMTKFFLCLTSTSFFLSQIFSPLSLWKGREKQTTNQIRKKIFRLPCPTGRFVAPHMPEMALLLRCGGTHFTAKNQVLGVCTKIFSLITLSPPPKLGFLKNHN